MTSLYAIIVAVVYGHLHIRTSQLCDGVRFEETSPGYPQQWQAACGMAGYLRKLCEDGYHSACATFMPYVPHAHLLCYQHLAIDDVIRNAV